MAVSLVFGVGIGVVAAVGRGASKAIAAAAKKLASVKTAATLGGYFCCCAIKNCLLKLNEKGESDIRGALCDAFKDMTAKER